MGFAERGLIDGVGKAIMLCQNGTEPFPSSWQLLKMRCSGGCNEM
jgi:hypothetical protein